MWTSGSRGNARQSVTIHFECAVPVTGCPSVGVVARVKDRYRVTLVDLPMNGRATRVGLAQTTVLLS